MKQMNIDGAIIPEKINSEQLRDEIAARLGVDTSELSVSIIGEGESFVRSRDSEGKLAIESRRIAPRIVVQAPRGFQSEVEEVIAAHAPALTDAEKLQEAKESEFEERVRESRPYKVLEERIAILEGKVK